MTCAADADASWSHGCQRRARDHRKVGAELIEPFTAATGRRQFENLSCGDGRLAKRRRESGQARQLSAFTQGSDPGAL